MRLFCFPYAGGSASVFRTWSSELPAEIEVLPIQLPGRETRLREAPFTHISQLLPKLTEVLRPYMTMPFAFFGHSLGALIAFELTRHLRREGEPGPVHLFMSGHRAPQRPNPDPPIHELPDAEFMEEVRQFNGTPEELLGNAEMMRLVLPFLRADFTIYETYVYTPEEPLDCSISALGGLGDVEVSREDSAAWRELTRGTFSLRMFPGNHFFLNSARRQVVQAVAQDLMRLLQRMSES
jgi:medium-chain acyl-[acyl-carrier-protein] hydrolase